MAEIKRFKDEIAQGKNPRDIKFLLAKEIVARFHSVIVADHAQDDFIARFQKGALPEDMPEIQLATVDGCLAIANVLKEAGLTQSTSEAMRMIKQGAVRIDNERVGDQGLMLQAGAVHVIQVGKRRFARISFN